MGGERTLLTRVPRPIRAGFIEKPFPAPSACFSCGINHFLLTLCSAPNMLHWSNPEISSHFSTQPPPTPLKLEILRCAGRGGGLNRKLDQNTQNKKQTYLKQSSPPSWFCFCFCLYKSFLSQNVTDNVTSSTPRILKPRLTMFFWRGMGKRFVLFGKC